MAQGEQRIPEINLQLQRHLQDKNEVVLVSLAFNKQQTNESRVNFVYDLLQENGLLPNMTIDGKSNVKSEKFRQQGNEKFKQKKSREAHEFYTKSVAVAELGSEHLSLGYANRSAVLFDVGLYEECLQDIQNALQTNYPEKLKPKLLSRQSKAKELQNIQIVEFNTPVPRIPPEDQNPSIQSASRSVKIEYSESLGRHVVAARDIEPGEIIAVEKPFSKVLTAQFDTHCHHCLKLCYTLIPCPRCTQAMFCSETCLTEAYGMYHQYECALLLSMLKLDVDHRHLHLRVTILARDRFRDLDKCKVVKDGVYKSDRYEEIHNLVSNTSSRSVSDLFNRSVHAAALFHLIKTQTSFFSGLKEDSEKTFKELLLHHMQVGPCNFHEIVQYKSSDESLEGEPIGDGAYSFLSMFNHSCYPNVVRYSYRSTTVLIALEPIKSGEQCFDNYGCHHAVMLKQDRQAKLKKQYFFGCTCTACNEDYPLYQYMEDHGCPADYMLSIKELKKLEKFDLVEAKKIFPKLLQRIKTLANVKPDRMLSELQEAFKQCCFIFAMVKTPF